MEWCTALLRISYLPLLLWVVLILTDRAKNSNFQDDVDAKCRDISEAMRDRVAKGYGFNAAQNVKILNNDVVLQTLWEWLTRIPTPPTSLMKPSAHYIEWEPIHKCGTTTIDGLDHASKRTACYAPFPWQ